MDYWNEIRQAMRRTWDRIANDVADGSEEEFWWEMLLEQLDVDVAMGIERVSAPSEAAIAWCEDGFTERKLERIAAEVAR